MVGVGALQQVALDELLHRLQQVLVVSDVHVQGNERCFSGISGSEQNDKSRVFGPDAVQATARLTISPQWNELLADRGHERKQQNNNMWLKSRETATAVALALRRCVYRTQVDEKFAYKNSEMRTNEKK